MKAKIIITPKKAVLDPQGKTVQNAKGISRAGKIGNGHPRDAGPSRRQSRAERA